MLNSRDINLLRPDVAQACREVIARAKAQGIDIIITSTVRDDEYQAYIYEQGRTRPGNPVTNQKLPTFHWQKTGLAFDFCPVDAKGNCLWNDLAKFRAVGKIATELGLEWGGNWKSFVDSCHIQWSGGGKYTSNMVRALQLPPTWTLPGATPAPSPAPAKTIAVNATVRVVGSTYATGQSIPGWVRRSTLTVGQVKADKVLLKPINSWVFIKDVEVV